MYLPLFSQASMFVFRCRNRIQDIDYVAEFIDFLLKFFRPFRLELFLTRFEENLDEMPVMQINMRQTELTRFADLHYFKWYVASSYQCHNISTVLNSGVLFLQYSYEMTTFSTQRWLDFALKLANVCQKHRAFRQSRYLLEAAQLVLLNTIQPNAFRTLENPDSFEFYRGRISFSRTEHMIVLLRASINIVKHNQKHDSAMKLHPQFYTKEFLPEVERLTKIMMDLTPIEGLDVVLSPNEYVLEVIPEDGAHFEVVYNMVLEHWDAASENIHDASYFSGIDHSLREISQFKDKVRLSGVHFEIQYPWDRPNF